MASSLCIELSKYGLKIISCKAQDDSFGKLLVHFAVMQSLICFYITEARWSEGPWWASKKGGKCQVNDLVLWISSMSVN